MGRKKSRPIRSGRIVSEIDIPSSSSTEQKLENGDHSESVDANSSGELAEYRKPFYVDIDRSHWSSKEYLDIAEIVLHDVNFANGIIDHGLVNDSFMEYNFSLRFRLCDVDEGSFRLGQWPVLPADNVFLEYLISEDVIFSGVFDGSDEGVSGLAHLVSLKLLGLRFISGAGNSECMPSFRIRVEILQNAFDACASLLEIVRQPWRKSMMNVMSWLRPEVTTSEARYRSNLLGMEGPDTSMESIDASISRAHAVFDADSFYEAIKPSKEEPVLEDDLPDLLPQLRPYQRRAVYWMAQREKSLTESSGGNMQNQQSAPFCIPVVFLERHSGMFMNSSQCFSGFEIQWHVSHKVNEKIAFLDQNRMCVCIVTHSDSL